MGIAWVHRYVYGFFFTLLFNATPSHITEYLHCLFRDVKYVSRSGVLVLYFCSCHSAAGLRKIGAQSSRTAKRGSILLLLFFVNIMGSNMVIARRPKHAQVRGNGWSFVYC